MIESVREHLRRSSMARRAYRRVRNSLAPSHLVVVMTTGVGHADGRRTRLMRTIGIDVVLDVGANAGQYGHRLRHAGYRGRIVSFEPLKDPYHELARAAHGDDGWTAVRLALGDTTGELEVNVAANSVSSSPLPMLSTHARTSPSSSYVGVETVPVARLDDAWDDFIKAGETVMLKVDTQGFEERVLSGGANRLDGIAAIELELSLVPLYAGGANCRSLVDVLAARGFDLASLDPGLADPVTGQLLQIDGLYVRRGLLPARQA